MTVTKMKSFVKQFIAEVKGDDVAAKAEKAFRQASSALKSQISSLEGDTINLEDKVETAETDLKLSIINKGNPIEDRESYIRNLLNRKNLLTQTKDQLDIHHKKIEFLKETLKNLEEEVSAE